MSINGIDVSNNQGKIDWAAVAGSGVQFAIVKCTEGTGFVDGWCPVYWPALAANGLLRGLYHFARPDSGTPEAEARWFLAHLPALAPGDVVALDLEAGSGDLGAWALTWLQTVEAALGFKPLLYSGAWFMTPHGLNTAALAEYGLWLAAYQTAPPSAPAPWPFVAIWQRSGSGRVPGVSGDCDLDVFNGDVSAFKRYGLPAAPAPTPLQPFDTAARLQLCAYAAGGSGVRDLTAWLAQYTD